MGNSVTAIILAAGCGNRMKLNITKQKILISDETVLRRSVRIFNECSDVDQIIIVTRSDEVDFATEQARGLQKVKNIVVGGETRAESAKIGFMASDADYVAIHDAARCFVTGDIISTVISDAKKYGAATASSRVTDSVKIVDQSNFVSASVDRSTLRSTQTPQVFSSELYKKALDSADISNPRITDDNALLELIGVHSYCSDTGNRNIKLTTPEDLSLVGYLINGENNE